jgi:hypothetical protein
METLETLTVTTGDIPNGVRPGFTQEVVSNPCIYNTTRF